jgi:hypothetical protein
VCYENQRILEEKKAFKILIYKGIMVPRGGIEPPTRGFSVLCSTD